MEIDEFVCEQRMGEFTQINIKIKVMHTIHYSTKMDLIQFEFGCETTWQPAATATSFPSEVVLGFGIEIIKILF